MQNTNTILMIEPVAFGFNEETAINNYFQKGDHKSVEEIQAAALAEFNALAKVLEEKGISVIVVKDTISPHTPDSIFPNNWISFHNGRTVVIYPMFAKSRRAERRFEIISIINENGFQFNEICDYSMAEKEHHYLEGTGSMILDRENKIIYAALSERTQNSLLERFANDFGYRSIPFSSFQTVGDLRLPIYHTNVMMSVADHYVIICLECINYESERSFIINTIRASGKVIIEISEAQMHHFAGNMLQVVNQNKIPYLVMSQTAYNTLNEDQKTRLQAYNEFIICAVPTIETYGGGSVRCMMGEVF